MTVDKKCILYYSEAIIQRTLQKFVRFSENLKVQISFRRPHKLSLTKSPSLIEIFLLNNSNGKSNGRLFQTFVARLENLNCKTKNCIEEYLPCENAGYSKSVETKEQNPLGQNILAISELGKACHDTTIQSYEKKLLTYKISSYFYFNSPLCIIILIDFQPIVFFCNCSKLATAAWPFLHLFELEMMWHSWPRKKMSSVSGGKRNG